MSNQLRNAWLRALLTPVDFGEGSALQRCRAGY
jgi:hypothetical protein